jgi:DNA topoisomerase VI subunit B
MATQSLARKTFAVSRLSEFVSTPELVKQIGHAIEHWPEVVIKETLDNALDEAEEAGIAPKVEVAVDTANRMITVVDHGRGVAPETVEALVDLAQKVSSRAGYVSPTRGQQGNALQTILAMPCALDNAAPGETVIESRGVQHRIAFEIDPLREIPVTRYEQAASVGRNGTRIAIRWPEGASSILEGGQLGFFQAARAFAAFNPHLDLVANWDADSWVKATPTAADWKRWRPRDPMSPHWYDVPLLKRLIGREIAHAEDKGLRPPTVREFVAQFHSLSSTAKGREVLTALSAQGASLRHVFDDDRVAALLHAMRATSQPVNPRRLGVVGREHLMGWATVFKAASGSFEYRVKAFEHLGLPYVAEVAFAHAPERRFRLDLTGLNFSPVIGGRPFGRLDAVLGENHAGRDAPVVMFIHLTCPRFDFTDKGKSAVELPPEVGATMEGLVVDATKNWTRQRKAEIRDASARLRRAEALDREARKRKLTQKEAAFEVTEEAYLKASADGTLPANARQIFYVARPLIMALLGGTSITSQYFTQTLLPAYLEECEPDWEPAYDARGHFTEPHTNRSSGLGTLDVEDYLEKLAKPKTTAAVLAKAKVETHGPEGRYGGVLFIEKEGFMPLMETAKIGEKFDLLVTSSKGFSVTAARRLIDVLCGKLGLPLFILHDFDISGFGIAKTLTTDSRRYRFQHKIKRVVDLGLRVADVRAMDLDNEEVVIGKNYGKTAARLRINGASKAEIAYLLDGEVDDDGNIVSGHRVELNAMTSDQFVAFVERKLLAAGARKVVPDTATMAEAYVAFKRENFDRPAVEQWLQRRARRPVSVPADLEALVRKYLAEHPAETWDAAVREIADEEAGDG